MEDITYYALVERICRKIRVDESKVQVKISYFPMVLYSYKPSYIWNDEDVFGYLLQVNHEKCRSVLHVEFNKTVEDEDDEADVYVSLSDREATDTWATDREACEADGVLTLYEDLKCMIMSPKEMRL